MAWKSVCTPKWAGRLGILDLHWLNFRSRPAGHGYNVQTDHDLGEVSRSEFQMKRDQFLEQPQSRMWETTRMLCFGRTGGFKVLGFKSWPQDYMRGSRSVFERSGQSPTQYKVDLGCLR